MATATRFHLALITLAILLIKVQAQNYCNASLCNNGRKHIACNNNGAFSSQCPASAKIISMTTRLREIIVNDHNRKRNQIAGGNLPNYSSARRMASMQWNSELARLAVLNVKRCVMKHDQCRNTRRFPLAGQNLAVSSWAGKVMTVEQVIKQHINMWWNEYKHCSMSYINNYRAPPKGSKPIGHFTQMAQERATHVGCGVLRLTRNGRTQQFTACNYAFTNIVNRSVYRRGGTANLCRTGRNTFYPNLCKRAEVYNVKSGNYN